jgi:hypothetical protein
MLRTCTVSCEDSDGHQHSLIIGVLSEHEQPSAWDLVKIIESALGWKARWIVPVAVNQLRSSSTHSTKAWRGYLGSLMESGDLNSVLRGVDAPKTEIVSSIDCAIARSTSIRNSSERWSFSWRGSETTHPTTICSCVPRTQLAAFMPADRWRKLWQFIAYQLSRTSLYCGKDLIGNGCRPLAGLGSIATGQHGRIVSYFLGANTVPHWQEHFPVDLQG